MTSNKNEPRGESKNIQGRCNIFRGKSSNFLEVEVAISKEDEEEQVGIVGEIIC
jgi:hypothetical protein